MCARECGCARRGLPSVSAGAGFFARVASRKPASSRGAWGCGPGRGRGGGRSPFVVVSSAWRAEGGRAWVGRLAARACWPPGLPGGRVARGERAST